MLNKRIDELQEQLLSSTQRLLKIRSLEGQALPGMPFGKEVNDVLMEALKISEELGFKTKNVDGYAGYAEYGDGDEYIGVLGHLDVVPEGSGWNHEPYGGEISDGKVWGRGSLDDKGPIVAALYGLKAIKDLNLPLSKKVRIIFGTNEETGCGEIEYYLKKEKAPIMAFTPDAEFPIIYAEKGILNFTMHSDFSQSGNVIISYIKGGERANIVPGYCEALVKGADRAILDSYIIQNRAAIDIEECEEGMILKSHGVSAHGSTPEKGKNAIMELILALNTLDIDGKAGIIIDTLAYKIGRDVNGENIGAGLWDEPSGKLTLNAGVINMTETSLDFRIDIRYPVTKNKTEILDGIENSLKESEIEIKDIDEVGPLYFSKDHELIKKLQKAYAEVTGFDSEPLAIGGGTYAKSMPNTVAFGPAFPGRGDLAHQPNEYISIDDLMMSAKIYGRAIYELAK